MILTAAPRRHRRRPTALVAALLAWCPGTLSCYAPADGVPPRRGPIPSRVEHPVSVGVLSMRPRRARVLPVGGAGISFDFAYQSIHEVQHNDNYRVAFDGETRHKSLRVRAGLPGEMDIELEIGTLTGRGGFLDGFAENWHDLTGFPDGGRSRAPKDLYRMRLRDTDGNFVYQLEEEETGMTDLPIILTKQISTSDDESEALAFRVGVELPTGDEDTGHGNGALDGGFGLLGEKHMARASWFAAIDYVVTGQPESFKEQNVRLENMLHMQLGVELPIGPYTSVLTQLEWVSPLMEGVGLEELGAEILDLGIGIACNLSEDVVLRTSFHEDVIAASGPDFTVLFGVSWGL